MEVCMEKLFLDLFHRSISASYLILAVLLVRFLLRKAPKSMRGFLWLLVGIRLFFPFSVESVFSLVPDTKAVDAYIFETEPPAGDAVMMTGMKQSVSQPAPNTDAPAAGFAMNKPQTALTVCTKIWIAGMALMLAYMLFSYIRLRNRVKVSIPTDIVVGGLDGTSDKNCSVKIYQSDAIESPFLFGILRPRIYIPGSIPSDEIPYVVRHELTHKKRKDYLIKPLGFLLLSVYWFNPCVWAAYIMLCKDIELICDEHVVRELGTEYKKAYSQALLNSAVNHQTVAACPIAFGEVGVKERVKNVLHYKKPAFWVLAAAVLACVIVPVCFMTQKKTEAPKQTDAPQEEAVSDKSVPIDSIFTADDIIGEYEMFLPRQDELLSLEEYNDLYGDSYLFTPRLNLDKDGKFSFGYDPASSYLSFGDYDFTQDCVKAVTEDGKYHYQFTCIGNGLLRFDADESSDLHPSKIGAAAPLENGSVFVRNSDAEKAEEIPDAAKTIKKWAEAFCDRDAGTILQLASEDVKHQFIKQDLLFLGGGEDDAASFGWSSPWPWGDIYDENSVANNYHIVSMTEHGAEILYYAWVSDPHVTVWREQLTYEMRDGSYAITSEALEFMDGICTAEEFNRAYPDGIAETMMDYYSVNGAGEALNNNAKADRVMYEKLFEPDSAAVYLLNMLNNQNKVETHVTKSDAESNACTVTFEFHLMGGSVEVQMIQPYGSDGIWLPHAGGADMLNAVE